MPHDKKGKPLSVGQTVLLFATVIAVSATEEACNVQVEIEGEGEHRPQVALNSKLVEVQGESNENENPSREPGNKAETDVDPKDVPPGTMTPADELQPPVNAVGEVKPPQAGPGETSAGGTPSVVNPPPPNAAELEAGKTGPGQVVDPGKAEGEAPAPGVPQTPATEAKPSEEDRPKQDPSGRTQNRL